MKPRRPRHHPNRKEGTYINLPCYKCGTLVERSEKMRNRPVSCQGCKEEHARKHNLENYHRRRALNHCRGCGTTKGVIKFYIIADDLENPKPYHPACMRKLQEEVVMKLSDIHSQISV